MKVEEAKVQAKSLHELGDCSKDFGCSIKNTAQSAGSARKLWREGNKSNLIKLGAAIFVFPEPTPVCEIIGAGVMAAGVIQQGIKNHGIYAEDITKTLKRTMRELQETKNCFKP
ncbi:MAG: hypothetical protein NWE95_07825 [Candidatus Bathyarchaeota archaeon]|nr:hypothetical protein [Candidatus Bathyarchaeota archaeon]